MNISFENKLRLGFIGNLLIVALSGSVFLYRTRAKVDPSTSDMLDLTILFLIGISLVLLVVVYVIIRSQFDAKKRSQQELLENKLLLQSILDNTNSPMSIKKLNGEYLLINRQCEELFHVSTDEVIGKTDHDIFPKEQADALRNADLEVLKAAKELKIEEHYQVDEGLHTYLSVKFPLFDAKGRVYAIGSISTDITSLKKEQQSLKDGENFFKYSMDMLVIASDAAFIKVNPATTLILGYTEEELLGRPFLSFVHPEDVDVTLAEVAKLQKGLTTISFENRYLCKDGSFKWLNWNTYPDTDTGLLYAVARDVTSKKLFEDSIKAADNFFKMSLEIMVIANDGYFEKFNPALLNVLGYDSKELKDKPFLAFVHPEDREITENVIERLRIGEPTVNFENRWICKDGSIKWLSWTATPDDHGNHLYATARDITKAKNDTEMLLMADRFFKMSFEMLMVANTKYFLKVNDAFTRILGYEQKEAVSMPFMDIVHPDDMAKTVEVVEKLKQGHAVVNYRLRIRCKDKSFKWLEVTGSIDNESNVVYAVARDITEQVKLENGRQMAINELMANEEKLELILENINEGVIVTDDKREVILANYVANEMFGIQNNDKITANLTDHFELYFPDEKSIFPSQLLPLEKALNGEPTNDVDIVLWDPEQQEKRRVLMSGRPLVDPQNKVVAAVVTVKDISRYKQLEEELQVTEQKYRRLIGFKKDQGEEVPEARLASRVNGKLPQ